ncbi:uncharacterized protein LOC143364156 [Halictus rubicundus]|uniref:uncharacterized protein LOC143363193 n=1 Tax=Halictus rubicundus TaxID=77578 RepID=UPI00403580D6
MDVGDGCIKLLHDHNHSKLLHRIDQEKMKHEMLQLCRETAFPLKQIFDDVCRKYPDAASVLSYNSVKATLLRERQKSCPPIPPCLAALYEYLRTSSFMENIYKIMISDGDGKVAILFSTELLLQTLNTSQCIYADGIFSIVFEAVGAKLTFIVNMLFY